LWLWKKITAILENLFFPLRGLTVTAAKSNVLEGNPFVRVLSPSDPWTAASSAHQSERADGFRGGYEKISVAMESRCDPLTVLAAYHGARREVGLDGPAYYRFFDSEVFEVGGDLENTPATPPWPDDYNDAHHDIVSGQKEVADYMARAYESSKERVQWAKELEVLERIAELLAREDVDKKFRKGARYRFRRMFQDKGRERELWKNVAKTHKILLDHPETIKDLRKLYNDRDTRPKWKALLDEIGIPEGERQKYH
jgi:hypothetical protein